MEKVSNQTFFPNKAAFTPLFEGQFFPTIGRLPVKGSRLIRRDKVRRPPRGRDSFPEEIFPLTTIRIRLPLAGRGNQRVSSATSKELTSHQGSQKWKTNGRRAFTPPAPKKEAKGTQ